MLFFKTDKEYKTVATGLRRELKALGLTETTHNQLLEVVAKSMGHKSYAALLAVQPKEAASPEVPSGQVALPTLPQGCKPFMFYAYAEEPRFLAELTKYAGYRLSNKGDLDFVKGDDTALVHGRSFHSMQGTLDDIWNCSAGVNSAERESDGSLDVQHDGDTDVNWDGQVTRKDTRGVKLWMNGDGDAVPEDRLVLVPEDWAHGEDINLLSEEVLEEYELTNREPLVDACFRWIRDNEQVDAALEELAYDEDWDGFTDEFPQYADAVGSPGAKKASIIGQAQWVAGFVMHVGEFKALRLQLLAAK